MDAATQSSSLLSKLENYDYYGIDKLFSDYLHPFSLLKPTKPQNPTKKPSKHKQPPSSSSIRSLAKTYLPFVSKSLSLFPKRLSESPKHPKTQQFITQLLVAYQLCLDCLDAVSSELSGKPYAVHLQRVRFIHCLMRWERYEEAIDEGFRVLKLLGEIRVECISWKVSMGKLVPRLVDSSGVEDDFVHLIVDVVVTISQCISMSRTKDVGKYSGLLILLDEVRPWFKYMDASACSKLRWKLLTYMRNATMFLVREVEHFEGDLVAVFCAAVFDEYIQLLNGQSPQGRMGEEPEEFVKFISNCTYKCRSACLSVRLAVAVHLYKSAGKFSQDLAYFSLIQRLYAMGLYLSEFSFQSNSYCSPVAIGSICTPSGRSLPESWDKLQDLSALLGSGKKYYYSNLDEYKRSQRCEIAPCSKSGNKASKDCTLTNGEAYLFIYLDALKFVCWPLAEFVNSERKRVVVEELESPLGNALKLIQETLLEYCSLFPYCWKEKDAREEIEMIVLSISMAAFTVSLKLNFNTKESKRLLIYVLSDKCIQSLQPQRLKYIIAMLHNIFVEFYRKDLLREASKALKLCCRASWSRCLLLCEMLVGKLKGFDEELSENMIVDSVNEACKVGSLLMDILQKTDSHKLEKVIEYSLEKWCLAKHLFGKLPSPVALVQHWVKIHCKSYKNTDANAPILGSFLLCSPCIIKHNVSTETVRVILEQELLAYQEMSNLYPKFSQRMQLEIIDILLEKLIDSDNCLQRSSILLKKGMLLRSNGIDGLQNCVRCLSQAIESNLHAMNASYGVTHEEVALVSHQLAVLYCLRALCTQEAEPNSKEVFSDIRKAVSLRLRTDFPDCSSSDQSDMGYEYELVLLYHIADLLSIKGDTALHSDVLNVIIKNLKRMNVSLEKCISLLWESRRCNHALCVVPVDETFILALSEHYGKDAESLDFWITSVKDNQPQSVGLEQNFSFLSTFFPLAFHQRKHSLASEVSVDEVKEAASYLISNVSMPGCSAFLAGYLYHNLSERLCATGQMIEALFYAKEAHQLRGKLLQKYFSCTFEQGEEKCDNTGETIQKPLAFISHFTVSNQVVSKAWPNTAISRDLGGLVLTPWNVLRCYLESTLQVGIIHETLGNGAEAEAQFRLGKNISCLQSLPMFIIAFSSCLGKVYGEKCLLDLAHKELVTAEQVLAVEKNSLTCSRCSLMLESTVSEQLGDLYRSGVNCAMGNPYESSLRSLISLEKGDLDVWLNEENSPQIMLQDEVAKTKTEAKKSRKTKKATESIAAVKSCTVEQNSRVTRSRKQSSQRYRVGCVEEVQKSSNSCSKSERESEEASVSNKVNCEKCFSSELKNFDSFTCFIQMKWEFFRRRQILRLLIGLGKCQAGMHRLHKIYSKCISVLVGGNDCHCSSSPPLALDSIGNEIPGDILAVERAEILYNLSWFVLKALYSKDIRSVPSDVCCIQIMQVVSLLKLSFVLTREVPSLFQKVSRLLALVYVVSTLRKNSSSPFSSRKVLSENYWAAYFHQASVGAHHNVRLLQAITIKHKTSTACDVEGAQAADPIRTTADVCTLLRRIVPESTEEIEEYVENFFENLPSTTIVCISLLGGSYASLLKELMHYPSSVNGWILLSHLNADNQPAVVLLPLSSLCQDEERGSSSSIFGEKTVKKEWCSPWGCSTVVDDVAPLFKLILRGNYVSCSSFPEEDTERNRETWWTQRVSLDKCLHKLLRDMEESWFGPWRYLLLGRWLDCEPLDSAVKELVREIKKKCKLDLNESILKVVLGGFKSASMERERIPWLFLEKSCYIGGVEHCDRERRNTLDEACDGGYISDSLFELIVAAVNKLDAEYCTRREPVVLVLDSDIQMLPWENIPILREQEVYRMPSVASIFLALQRRSILEEDVSVAPRFPLIDPLDAFYVLNPSGDLGRTQSEFEEWFKLHNMQGKAGVIPSTQELTEALENHDLFLYFGHGSGAQYIPTDKIQKLENCSATLLMGCSSGSLRLNGHYTPTGTSLSYMLAGSPIVVANLWEVTDLDIDRFAKSVLKSFMEERSMSSTGCVQCSMLAEEFKSMKVKEKKGNTKKGRGKKKVMDDDIPDISGEYCFKHKLRAGYFVSQARKSCKLPFLIGAAPVCYGVPTGIKKKKDL